MSVTNPGAPKRNILGGLLGLLGMSGVAGVLVTAMITPLIAVTGVAANSTISLFENLPTYLEIGSLQQKTELYASNGQKFAEFYNQNREEVSLDQISPYVAAAAISVEDPRFREHGGVDVISAARALAQSVIGDGAAGASTITMQYVRNVRVQTAEAIPNQEERDKAYLEATETTTGRKLQEMRLAIGVEKQFSKDEILQGYLNIALFGGTTYGIESAAQRYFGKSALDLNLQESASLIAIVQEPNAYRLDVPENIEANKIRRDYILMRMMEEGAIDQATYEATIATPVEPRPTEPRHGCGAAEGNAQYFCDYVRLIMVQDPAFGETYEERQFNFQTKGYQIKTTLDLDMQAQGQASMASAVPAYVEGMDMGSAASMVEEGTGRVLMMVQNTAFGDTEELAGQPGYTSVNYNTDYEYGGSTGFQVGSTYKMFTLAEWLASGKSLNASVNGKDRAFNLINFQNSCLGADGGSWSPTNDGGAKVGNVSVRQATSQSINTAYVAMAEQLDQCRIRDTAMAMGAHRADGAVNESNPAAVLGTNTIAPLSMATAVAGFANGGVTCSPIAIDSITLRDGSSLEAPKSTCNQAVTPEVAAGVTSALQGVANGGTGSASNPGIAPLMGKTGTTDSGLQTWMVGATSKVGLAVWVGNASGQVPMYGVDLPRAVGSQTRHVIFNDVIAQAMRVYGGDSFPEPTGSAVQNEQVTVPDLAGKSTAEAKTSLEGLGFSVSVGNPVESDQPEGTVASTLPSANTRVTQGTTITINPSRGPDTAPTSDALAAPDLAGQTQEQAQSTLSQLGFNGTMAILTEKSETVPSGQVIRTDPAPGAELERTGSIQVYVSSGP
ncbi:transglycosylase domain-containing protein [Pseudoclavibacter terrae]|uniref:PASTA domain-containing protein n=2 Tax=Pseudoclavibacter terrae TaxID=1530195 RepID=A0A7J5AZQ3_9MICO|nr:transglycosylase domain-containing protein [Pseudoclavibacter terrae]KAB1637090.1 PASTA domain-containing protein [Pseudoclavibacter terrae]